MYIYEKNEKEEKKRINIAKRHSVIIKLQEKKNNSIQILKTSTFLYKGHLTSLTGQNYINILRTVCSYIYFFK